MPLTESICRLRFSLRQLLLAVALVAVGMGVWNWAFRKEVVVRAATPDDDLLFGNYLMHQRNIAVATCRFTPLVAAFHLVQSGRIEEGEESDGGPIWERTDFGLALVQEGTPDAKVTRLLVIPASQRPFRGQSDRLTPLVVRHNINLVATETLLGRITQGRRRIIHVEGDRTIVVDGKMTLKDFAKANPGNYLVMTLEVK